MPQADYSIENASGAVVRADINDQLEAIATNNSGATAPSDTFPHMWWFDASTNLLKQRNAANTDWVTVASKAGGVWIPYRDGLAIPAWGTGVGDLVQLEDVGGGVAGLAAIDGSQLTNLPLQDKFVQQVVTQTGAVATGTTQIPYDDTIPQITEGDEYMTLAITPVDAANNLVIQALWNGANSGSNVIQIAALFRDSDADALAAVANQRPGTNQINEIKLTHTMTAGTTSEIVFRLRCGGHVAGTTTFNGGGGTRRFGGVMASSIIITEVVP